jgi:hypothetical protein
MLKYVGHRMTHTGNIKMHILILIPFLLYLSKSAITNPDKSTGAFLYSVHLTPWLAFSAAVRGKKKE